MKRFLWRSPIHLKIIAPILGFTAFGILVVYAIDTISEGWRVDHGATKNVTGADAICKKVTNAHAGNDYFVPTKTTTEWTAFQNNLPSGVTLNSCAATFVLTIAADTLDFNVRTAAIAAGWNGTETVAITVNVNPGITVGASTPTIPAFDTWVLPASSTVSIINNGKICGKWGAGWAGGGSGWPFSTSPGVAGWSGWPWLVARAATTVTNNGTIAGGGGGGGGGGGAMQNSWGALGYGGGGGGGGQSCGTNASGWAGWSPSWNGGNYGGGSGWAGTVSGAGAGGAGGSYVNYGWAGWSGWAFGAPGIAGSSGWAQFGSPYGWYGAGGTAGLGGCYVYGNSNITWATAGTVAGCVLSDLGYVFNSTISANTTNYDLIAAAVAAGWNQSVPLLANVTINSGVYVYATSNSYSAFTVGTLPYGSAVTITNNGSISGAGGGGGAGGAGGAGGKGLSIASATAVVNNGTISWGGGGGGGGAPYVSSSYACEPCLYHDGYNCITYSTCYTYGYPAGGNGATAGISAATAGSGGGAGGAAWQAGVSSAYAGGAAWPSAYGNSNVTWSVVGTLNGPLQ